MHPPCNLLIQEVITNTNEYILRAGIKFAGEDEMIEILNNGKLKRNSQDASQNDDILW